MVRLLFSRYLAILFLNLFTLTCSVFAKPTLFIISGGKGPLSNHPRYYENIKKAQSLFPIEQGWNHVYLVADGPNSDEPNSPLVDEFGKYVKTSENDHILQRKDPLIPKGSFYEAATKTHFEAAVKYILPTLSESDPILIYVTDHGDINGRAHINLWKETLNSDELAHILLLFGPKRRILMIQDQCFSGSMIEELVDPNRKSTLSLKGNISGFSASSPFLTANPRGQILKKIYELRQKDPDNFTDQYTVSNGKKFCFRKLFNTFRDSSDFSSRPTLTSERFLSKFYSKFRKEIDPNITLFDGLSHHSVLFQVNLSSAFEDFKHRAFSLIQILGYSSSKLTLSELIENENYESSHLSKLEEDLYELNSSQPKDSVDPAIQTLRASIESSMTLLGQIRNLKELYQMATALTYLPIKMYEPLLIKYLELYDGETCPLGID